MPWFIFLGVPAIVDSVVVLVVALKIVPQKIANATADLERQVSDATTEINKSVVTAAAQFLAVQPSQLPPGDSKGRGGN